MEEKKFKAAISKYLNNEKQMLSKLNSSISFFSIFSFFFQILPMGKNKLVNKW